MSEAAHEYAWALLRIHKLDPDGTVESPELDALTAELELLWPRMSGDERQMVTDLSRDLYAVADLKRQRDALAAACRAALYYIHADIMEEESEDREGPALELNDQLAAALALCPPA